MGTLITILIIIAAVILTLLVLVQNSKGGGLASGFSSGNQVMGAPKTADFLEKATWTLVGIIVFLSIVAVHFTKDHDNATKKAKETTVQNPAAAAEDMEVEDVAGDENANEVVEEEVNQ